MVQYVLATDREEAATFRQRVEAAIQDGTLEEALETALPGTRLQPVSDESALAVTQGAIGRADVSPSASI